MFNRITPVRAKITTTTPPPTTTIPVRKPPCHQFYQSVSGIDEQRQRRPWLRGRPYRETPPRVKYPGDAFSVNETVQSVVSAASTSVPCYCHRSIEREILKSCRRGTYTERHRCDHHPKGSVTDLARNWLDVVTEQG